MDEMLETAGKQVLVEVVKVVQKRGMEGTKGGWKAFLNEYDKKIGSSLSDPRRRTNDVLVAFLKTFTKKEDIKFLTKLMQCHLNRDIMEQSTKKSPDNESPEQRLVRLTLEHPQYPSEYSFPSHEEDWVVTKFNKKPKMMRSTAMVAVDCEMVLCEDGSEALVRVCVVDRDLKVKLNELVNPNKAVADYRTDITGIAAKDLEGVTCSLADVQISMKKLLSHGTILVGHSLNNDLQALKVDHARVIDTSFIFKYTSGPSYRRPSLNNLCKSVLGYEVREKGAPHNCMDDACAAMKLVLARIEKGVDSNIALVQEDVPDIERAKLLIHKIPINMPSEDLHSIIPGNFVIELKPTKRARPENYSALALFKNAKKACQAYESIEGSEEKDTSGRPQKLVTFQLSTGVSASLYVRKMVSDDDQMLSKKRALQAEDLGITKKQKADKKIEEAKETDLKEPSEGEACYHLREIERLEKELSQAEAKSCDHLQEIERLKTELCIADTKQCDHLKVIEEQAKRIESLEKDKSAKDAQISVSEKMVSNLKKKLGRH